METPCHTCSSAQTTQGGETTYFAAIEPVTGRPDNLDAAVNQWKDYAKLKPKAKTYWKQTITLAHNIKHVERVENEKSFKTRSRKT
jgi:hypothetical protein